MLLTTHNESVVGREPQIMLFVHSGKFPDLGSSSVQELAIFSHFLVKQLEITLFGLPYGPECLECLILQTADLSQDYSDV